jgi:hypothetical protein
MKYVTKQGKEGTLYKYKMEYEDPYEPGFGRSSWYCYAYNKEHAEEKFYDAGDDDGFEIVSGPSRVKKSGY